MNAQRTTSGQNRVGRMPSLVIMFLLACSSLSVTAAGFEHFKNFERDAKDFAELGAKPLPMPVLVLGGEKSGGEFLIAQTKLVASNVQGKIISGSGHWLMDEALQATIPALTTFLNAQP